MARHTVDAQPRSEFGNGPSRRLRQQGLVPGVLYRTGEDSLPLVLNAHELSKVLFSADGRSSVIDLAIDGAGAQPTVLTDWQLDPIRSEVLHVDFRPATDAEIAGGDVERRREAAQEVFVASKRSAYFDEDEFGVDADGEGEAAAEGESE
jgi:ribosomal protein L25 (general stress protein Ctc)